MEKDKSIGDNSKDNYDKIKEFSDDVEVEYLDTPIKSNNDKKNYRVIKLKNGLTALLIADTPDFCCAEKSLDSNKNQQNQVGKNFNTSQRREQVAACALCIGVGSFNDPPEIPGMAHLLEHMVIKCSKKYSCENTLGYINKKQGNINATTLKETTRFNFSISNKNLAVALDRLANFFIAPIITKNIVLHEKQIVAHEFLLKMPMCDLARKIHLRNSLTRPNHPASKFSFGNAETLCHRVTNDTLYEKLHEFREQYYSAHRMTLAIQAPTSLETLEEYVKNCFSEIPCNNLPPEDFSIDKDSNPFDTINFRRIYKVKSIENICQVNLTWSMPPLHHLYQTKPHQYVSWIIGHEGKGSIISFLRKKMWCLDVSKGSRESGFEHSSLYTLFSLSLVLTDEGHAHLKEVIDVIFSYINMMRKQVPQKEIFDEIRTVEDINFKFTDEKPSVENVESLSENMQYYKPVHYITGSELYFEYDPVSIQACMDVLTPENVNIIISDKKFDDSQFDKVEPWLKTKYKDEEIPADWIESWKNVEPMPELFLPKENRTDLTQNFTVIIPKSSFTEPVANFSDNKCSSWFMNDNLFQVPKSFIGFQLIPLPSIMSLKRSIFLELLSLIIMESSKEIQSSARKAGIFFSITSDSLSIKIQIYGFSEKMDDILDSILNLIHNQLLINSLDEFIQFKAILTSKYLKNIMDPASLNSDILYSLLHLYESSMISKLEGANKLCYKDFLIDLKNFRTSSYVKEFIYENYNEEKALKKFKYWTGKFNLPKTLESLNASMASLFGKSNLVPPTVPKFPSQRMVLLDCGAKTIKLKNCNPEDSISFILNYFQVGQFSVQLNDMVNLLVMLMSEPLFNQLRTEEIIGYVATCYKHHTCCELAFVVKICTQADKFTTEEVESRIEIFLKSFHETLESMSEEDFNNHKERIVNYNCDNETRTVYNTGSSFWQSLSSIKCSLQPQAESMDWTNFNKYHFSEWFKTTFLHGTGYRKLSVIVEGHKEENISRSNEKIEFTSMSDKIISFKNLLNYV